MPTAARRPNAEKNLYGRRDFLRKIGSGSTLFVLSQLTANPVMAGIKRSDSAAGSLYNEKHRPQFHFTPQKNWTNDPNGLVYYKGEYHMFFQHNPTGIDWGNMTWGHAVSTDLIHWKQLPNAIEPDEFGTIFSGSAVVDWNNTSGFQTGAENVLVAFYTSAGAHAQVKVPFTQSIAYSNDRGRTWTKYKDNPVIKHIRGQNRDPKVIWHEPTKTWIMALYLDKDDFALLCSKNLKEWAVLQELKLPGSSECPDFFELPVDGDPKNTRWVFWGANGRNLLGSFDGHKFSAESGPHESRVGNFYAAQTYSDIPESDGRRIQIAWMAGGKFPEMPFNQQMSIPCELTLRTFAEGIRLCRVPVREIKKLRDAKFTWQDMALSPGKNPVFSPGQWPGYPRREAGANSELLEIQTEIELRDAAEVGFVLRGIPVVYQAKDETLSCKDQKAKLSPVEGKIKLHILVDRTSVEVFPADGWVTMHLCLPLDPDNTSLELFARGGQARVQSLNLWKLKSIWPKA